MEKIVRFALAALFLLGIASAQNIPAVDVFGGYSYLNFDVPSSGETTSQRLKLNGWDFSASDGLFHHLAAEADISGHQLSDWRWGFGFEMRQFLLHAGATLHAWGSLQ